MEDPFLRSFLSAETRRIRAALERLEEGGRLLHQVDVDGCGDWSRVYRLMHLVLQEKLDLQQQQQGFDFRRLWKKSRSGKDAGASERCRLLGNQFLQKKMMDEALEQYTEAVLLAPFQSEAMSLALANRAMAWITLGHHHLAVEDIEAALQAGTYPQQSEFKLFQRLGKCLEAQRHYTEAVEAYLKAASLTRLSGLGAHKEAALRKEIRVSISLCQKKSKAESFIRPHQGDDAPPDEPFPRYDTPHPELPGASDALSIRYSEQLGRHAIAGRDIQPGECIIDETSLVHVPSLRYSLSHCRHCLRHLMSPHPCSQCSAVVFCGAECRQSGQERHRLECHLSLHDLYLQHGAHGSGYASLTFLPLQMVGMKSPQFFVDNWPAWSKPDAGALPSSGSRRPHLDKLDVAFNLAPDCRDAVDKMCTALFLLTVLRQCGYFSSYDLSSHRIEALPDERGRCGLVFFAALLMHFLCAVYTNNHSVSEIQTVGMGVQRRIVGIGLFPTVASIMNHCCDPNAATVMVKTRQVTVATRVIRAGEMISHIYQAHFGDTPLTQRQELLSRMYNFKCCCQACQCDYPLAKDLPQTYADMAGGPGLEERLLCELDSQHHQLGQAILSAMQDGDLALMADLFAQRLRTASNHLRPPHRIFLISRMGLVDSLWLRYGNRSLDAAGQKLSAFYV